MESSRSDHPPQKVSCSDRQPSQTVSCSDRQPVQDDDYLARCQQQARHTYTLPPGVSSAGLSEMEIARGDFYLRPNDRYTVRQQELLDMDEDIFSEDDWTWMKGDDGDLQSEDSFRPVESPHALGDGPTPPPPPPYREPPTPRCLGPPAKPIGDPTRNRGCTDVPPPSPRPLPPVPCPPAQPRRDWEEFESYFKSKSDAEIPDELRELMAKRWNSSEKLWIAPECFGRSTDCPPEQMSDLTAPDNGRTVVTQPLDCPVTTVDVRQRCTLCTVLSPSEDHVNHKRCKDARAIAIAHLSAAANPHLSRGHAELLVPQLSRGSSGATSSQEEHKQDLFRRPAQPPPPLPSERDLIRRPPQPPPPLPPPCYCLEYFTRCLRLRAHWDQHSNALQCFREWCRTRGLTSLVLDNWNENIVPKQPYGCAVWSADRPTWCWGSLLAQLTDDSLRRIVEGTLGASGIVACMVRESSSVDRRKRSAADQTTSIGNVKEVLYHWEFAFLRNNGTVAFLRPSPSSCKIEYYEGEPIGESAVATQQFTNVTICGMVDDPFPEFLFGDEGDITCRLDTPRERCPKNWFPNMSSLKLVYPVGIKFMEHRRTNYEKRGSASRPSPRRGMGVHQTWYNYNV